MLIDDAQRDFIFKRASYEVYKRFKVNKFELWLLNSLSWYLQHVEQTIVSRNHFFDTITGNSRELRKMEGYFQGLLRLKCIGTFEYISCPGSLSLGISDLGLEVLRHYKTALAQFSNKYPRNTKTIDGFPLSITAEPTPKYRQTA